jgi:hypothetical protein
VCERCLKEYGRKSFCHIRCRAHGPVNTPQSKES